MFLGRTSEGVAGFQGLQNETAAFQFPPEHQILLKSSPWSILIVEFAKQQMDAGRNRHLEFAHFR